MRLVVALSLLAAPASAQTLVVGMAQSIGDFHPFLTTQLATNYVLNAGRRVMTGVDNAGQVFCRLCTEVPTLANGRAKLTAGGMTVTYTLRPGLKWGDGVAMTARDFVFGLEVGNAFSPSVTIAAARALDAVTLEVDLKAPSYDFDRSAPAPLPAHLEEPVFRAAATPVEYGNKSLFNRSPEVAGLWNGPYRITRFLPGDAVTMEPNAHWDGPVPAYKKVTFRLIENTAALQANLLSGDVDMTGEVGLTIDQALGLEKSNKAKFDVQILPSLGVQQLYVRQDVWPLDDKRVRHALAMAIDRKTIVARLFEGRVPVADSFLTAGEFGAHPDIRTPAYDPKAARALLEQAGFKPGADGIMRAADGRRLSIDIAAASGNRLNDLLEQVMQSQFKAIGVELVIGNVPTRVLIGELLRYRKYQGVALLSYTPPPDWVPYVRFHSTFIPSEANNWIGSNTFGLRSAKMDAALMAARAALDPVERKRQWRDILEVAADELPVIPLYMLTSPMVMNRSIAGVVPPPMPGLSTLWIEQWKPR